MFNRIFSTGEFPSKCSECIIVPIHKKGNVNDLEIYRGISLIDCFSKFYISILSTRVTLFVNAYDKFVIGYSTVDNAFILQALISKYICKRGKKLYVTFVDFKKAFD